MVWSLRNPADRSSTDVSCDVELHILFGASDEEGTSLGQNIQAREVHITTIEQVEDGRGCPC